MNEIEKVERPELPAAITPMQMLSMAVSQGADLDKLTKLMDLQERWEKNEARKAFHRAFSAFKSEAVSVIRNKQVTDGPLKGKSYAELFAVVDAVTPALSKHDLSASWRLTKDEKDWIEVTCTITHVLGHSESVPMGALPDTGGAKNVIQARASTVTYLERYTLMAAVGLAAKGQDDDGGGGGSSGMNAAAYSMHEAAIDALTDKAGADELWKTIAQACTDAKDVQAYEGLRVKLASKVKTFKKVAA